jgi:predicted enzyme related to lactoylglutathione lyase
MLAVICAPQKGETQMTTSYSFGGFVWRELATSEPEKAVAFYSELFGWKIKETDMGGGSKYYLINNGEKQIGGIWPSDPKMKMPTFWGQYVSSENVDDTTKRAAAAGGKVFKEPMDIPNVGRFAIVQDAQGGVTMPFKSVHGDPPAGTPSAGEFCWESLSTSDSKAAIAFYTKVYGWQIKEFAPGMPYFDANGKQVASFMEDKKIPTHWLSYVAVSKLGESRDRAKRLGAKILMEEIPVPGIGKFAVIQDTVGATISLFEPAPMQKPN